MQTISNVSNTVAGAVRGPTENEGLLIDRADERQHYFLCRGERFRLYLTTLVCGTPLATAPPPIDHVFINSMCVWGQPTNVIQGYFTSPYPAETRPVDHGRITPARPK